MDQQTVREVAAISRLRLTDDEVKEFAKDLEEILLYFSLLDEASPAAEYDFNPVRIEDVTRDDEEGQDIEPESLRKIMDMFEDWVRGPRLI